MAEPRSNFGGARLKKRARYGSTNIGIRIPMTWTTADFCVSSKNSDGLQCITSERSLVFSAWFLTNIIIIIVYCAVVLSVNHSQPVSQQKLCRSVGTTGHLDEHNPTLSTYPLKYLGIQLSPGYKSIFFFLSFFSVVGGKLAI